MNIDDLTVNGLLEEIISNKRYTRCDLAQIISEGRDRGNLDEVIVDFYNACEDTELVVQTGTDKLVDLVKE